jgi:hypothetical protein
MTIFSPKTHRSGSRKSQRLQPLGSLWRREGLARRDRHSLTLSTRACLRPYLTSALGAALIPSLIGLAMGVSAGAFSLAIALLCLTAAVLHIAMQMSPTPLALPLF